MTQEIRTLTELLEKVSARRFIEAPAEEDLGLAEGLHFPFLAIVGQTEMKLALLLSLINPHIGGVLLIGPRGTGKTTSVRSLAALLPEVKRSKCSYGCLPEDIETGGIDAVCPDCAERYASGESLTFDDQVRLVELPLNSRIEDVVGGLDERAALHKRMRISRGILARADQNLLYVDEVNLLDDDIVDAILDASAQGTYTVRRGPISATYRARLVLIGSMNPEEGRLRPQIMDRFGLRVLVKGLEDPKQRLEAYRRTSAYKRNPRQVLSDYDSATHIVQAEINIARNQLPDLKLSTQAKNFGLKLIQEMGIDSLRAEITLFESAKAHAVAAGKEQASTEDIRAVAPMALRLRRSDYLREFFSSQEAEENELSNLLVTRSSRSKKGKS